MECLIRFNGVSSGDREAERAHDTDTGMRAGFRVATWGRME